MADVNKSGALEAPDSKQPTTITPTDEGMALIFSMVGTPPDPKAVRQQVRVSNMIADVVTGRAGKRYKQTGFRRTRSGGFQGTPRTIR